MQIYSELAIIGILNTLTPNPTTPILVRNNWGNEMKILQHWEA